MDRLAVAAVQKNPIAVETLMRPAAGGADCTRTSAGGLNARRRSRAGERCVVIQHREPGRAGAFFDVDAMPERTAATERDADGAHIVDRRIPPCLRLGVLVR